MENVVRLNTDFYETRGAPDYNKIKIKSIVGQDLYSRQDQAEAGTQRISRSRRGASWHLSGDRLKLPPFPAVTQHPKVTSLDPFRVRRL
jgi:hypothetical protein